MLRVEEQSSSGKTQQLVIQYQIISPELYIREILYRLSRLYLKNIFVYT